MKEKTSSGSRWGTLVLGVLWLANLWMDIRIYETLVSISHIYSPEELAWRLNDRFLLGVFHGIVAALCIWRVLIWNQPRPGMGDLLDGTVTLICGLVWGLLWFVCTPSDWTTGMTVLWIVALVLLVGAGLHDIWKYRKQKLLEETL